MFIDKSFYPYILDAIRIAENQMREKYADCMDAADALAAERDYIGAGVRQESAEFYLSEAQYFADARLEVEAAFEVERSMLEAEEFLASISFEDLESAVKDMLA